MSKRILVCGGRYYNDETLVFETLDKIRAFYGIIRTDIKIIVGDATGADAFARKWSKEKGIPREVHVADWKRYGSAAGPIRNQQMLEEGKPDLVIAFQGGRGTFDMCRRAEDAGVKVQYVLTRNQLEFLFK